MIIAATPAFTFVSVVDAPIGATILYELLLEADADINISNHEPPSWEEHLAFVKENPYRNWWLMKAENRYIGALYLTRNNEVGIRIFKAEQGKGYGFQAIKSIMQVYLPLPGIKSVRSDKWLANINPNNEPSIRMFEKLGFKHIQNTYSKE